jgi:hypothetical protein
MDTSARSGDMMLSIGIAVPSRVGKPDIQHISVSYIAHDMKIFQLAMLDPPIGPFFQHLSYCSYEILIRRNRIPSSGPIILLFTDAATNEMLAEHLIEVPRDSWFWWHLTSLLFCCSFCIFIGWLSEKRRGGRNL